MFPSPITPSGGGSNLQPPGANQECPNPARVTAGQLATATAVSVLNGIVQAQSVQDAEQHIDPAAWPWVTDLDATGAVPLKTSLDAADVSVSPAAGSPYAQTLVSLCGATILGESWAVAWCLSATAREAIPIATCLSQDAAETHYSYLVLRDGRWLVWQDQSG